MHHGFVHAHTHRATHWRLCMQFLNGDVFAIIPTGFGKSNCPQNFHSFLYHTPEKRYTWTSASHTSIRRKISNTSIDTAMQEDDATKLLKAVDFARSFSHFLNIPWHHSRTITTYHSVTMRPGTVKKLILDKQGLVQLYQSTLRPTNWVT